jgi:hypothetical protein
MFLAPNSAKAVMTAADDFERVHEVKYTMPLSKAGFSFVTI